MMTFLGWWSLAAGFVALVYWRWMVRPGGFVENGSPKAPPTDRFTPEQQLATRRRMARIMLIIGLIAVVYGAVVIIA